LHIKYSFAALICFAGFLYGRETSTPWEEVVVFRFGGYSDRGRVRERNEDAFLFDEALGLAIVADGMGGHLAGEIASQMAIELTYQHLSLNPKPHHSEALREALLSASSQIFERGRKDISKRDMGSTVVALWLSEDRATVAHVGDSRAYLCRNGEVKILTHDHTLVQELVNAGRITPQEAETHRFRNVLSRAMGVADETEIDVLEFELEPGDRLMLCSDGLYGYAAADAFSQLLLSPQEPNEKASSLVNLANECGGGDNITAVIVEVSGTKVKKSVIVEEYRDEPTLEMNSSQFNANSLELALLREEYSSAEKLLDAAFERNEFKTYEELPIILPQPEKPEEDNTAPDPAKSEEAQAGAEKTLKIEPIIWGSTKEEEIIATDSPKISPDEHPAEAEKTLRIEPIIWATPEAESKIERAPQAEQTLRVEPVQTEPKPENTPKTEAATEPTSTPKENSGPDEKP
jgi:serine/threonine protein phosphatase PrpC